MSLSRAQVGGIFQTIRAGHATARALAITDSRAVVRSLFLSSAIRAGLLDDLSDGGTFAEIAAKTDCVRRERLQAWLDIGTELGEITQRGGQYRVRGRRARGHRGRGHCPARSLPIDAGLPDRPLRRP